VGFPGLFPHGWAQQTTPDHHLRRSRLHIRCTASLRSDRRLVVRVARCRPFSNETGHQRAQLALGLLGTGRLLESNRTFGASVCNRGRRILPDKRGHPQLLCNLVQRGLPSARAYVRDERSQSDCGVVVGSSVRGGSERVRAALIRTPSSRAARVRGALRQMRPPDLPRGRCRRPCPGP